MMQKKSPEEVSGSSEDMFRLKDLWVMFAPRWHWFLISTVAACSLAALYLMTKPNVYTRTSSILLKVDDKGSGRSAISSSNLSDLGFLKMEANINNELVTITSPTLMTAVVQRLGLTERFTVKQGLRQVELYKQAPVSVTCQNEQTDSYGFNIEMTSPTTFTLSKMTNAEGNPVADVKGAFGQKIRTPYGTLVVEPTGVPASDFIGKEIRYSKLPLEGVTNYYTANLSAALDGKETTIIDLRVNDESPQKAEDILNTLVEVYNEFWVADKNQVAVSTSKFINERLKVIEAELGNVDDNISKFKSSNLVNDVQSASSMYMSENAENEKKQMDLHNRLAVAGFIREELRAKSLTQTLPSNAGIANINIETQISRYNDMVLERNRLLSNSSASSPVVQDLTTSMRTMQQAIVRSVDNLIASLRTELASLEKRDAATTSRLASSPGQAKYLLSVERQQKVKETLYVYLLQKREENEMSQAFSAYNTRVIVAPRGPAGPTSPRRSYIMLIAFAAGLALPAIIIYLLSTLNTKVRGRRDLGNMAAPFVGEIPLLKEHAKGENMKFRPVVVKAGANDTMNEAFRLVRTNLEFMLPKAQPGLGRVVMVTSFNSGSGKTFLSYNLATSFMLKGLKVLVVDLDLRRATMSRYRGNAKTGLTAYLSGQTDSWRELVVKGEAGQTVDFLPVGTLPPNPSELLSLPRFEEMVKEVRAEYDFVFFDCPPAVSVADTTIVSKYVDMTLFVVRAGVLERDMLPFIDELYAEHRFVNLALLLNGTTTNEGKYGYHYTYNYGYGHYSTEKKKSKLKRLLDSALNN